VIICIEYFNFTMFGIAIGFAPYRGAVDRMFDDVEKTSRAARKSMLLAARLADSEGRAHDIRIRNISATGLAAVTEADLNIEEVVMLGLPGVGPVMGVVTRVRGNQVGIRFESEIDADVVRASPSPQKEVFTVKELHKPAESYRRPGLKIR
jgi:PilZ domain